MAGGVLKLGFYWDEVSPFVVTAGGNYAVVGGKGSLVLRGVDDYFFRNGRDLLESFLS